VLDYLDLRSGRYHSNDLSNLPLLEKAVGDHLAAHHPGPAMMATPASPEAPAERSCVDISATSGGSATRERAIPAPAAQRR